MRKFFIMLPLVVALIALVGCKKNSKEEPSASEDLKENDSYYDSFTIGGCGIFGVDKNNPIAGTETQIQINETDTVDVQLYYCHLTVWDENVTYSNSTFSGDGFMLDYMVPLYIITSGEHKGDYCVPRNGYRVQQRSGSKPEEGIMDPGVIDPASYGDWISYVRGDIETVDETAIWGKTYGALFSKDNNALKLAELESSNRLVRGAINKMVINVDGKGNVISWGADITWSNVTSPARTYGFKLDPATKTLVKPYDFKTVNRKFHEEVLNAASQTPAQAPCEYRSVAGICKPLTLKR